MKRGRKGRRVGARHRLWHQGRSDPARAFLAGCVGGLDHGLGRRPAGPHDEAGTLIGDIVGLKAGIVDRLQHGDVVPGRPRAHEAPGLAIENFFEIELRGAVNLAAKAKLGKVRCG